MKTQLSLQEKLWELRKERNLKLDDVAKAVDISPATLSNYENKDYKDISLSLLTKLAKYYQVSLDWLAGMSETREPQNIAVSELFLDDATLELLKSQQFNNRLLCEIIKHPDFIKLMLHTEIYVDGVATMQIKNMNLVLNSIIDKYIEQHNPDANDLYLNTLQKSHIEEDEYFFHTIHNDWNSILRTIRKNHQYAIESIPIEPIPSTVEILERYQEMLKGSKDDIDACLRSICHEMDINYHTLSEKEITDLRKILKKSKKLASLPNHKHKGHKK